MAQTTPNASFGPVFVDPAQSVAYFVIKTYRYSKNLVSIEKKNERKEREAHLGPKRCI